MHAPQPNPGAPSPAGRSHWWGLIGLAFAVWFASQVVGAVAAAAVADGRSFDSFSGRDLFVVTLPFQLVIGGGAILLARWSGSGHELLRLGQRKWSDLPVGLAIGAALQLVVGIVYLPLSELFDRDTSAARELADRFDGGDIALLFLMAGVFAPIVEELFFRGVLQGALERLLRPWVGVVVAALLFALTHFQVFELLGLFIFGSAAGAILRRTDRMSLAVTVHMGFNMASLLVLATT
ncbi:MAG: CPBP family intramembrane metalloprotease [Acidimicrobiales bacterium]|nr:CPBP family intramembrane metalloprotease [Acidimicrobiales bacterium]